MRAPLKLIAVVGPTTSGKTALAIRLAKKFGGEVVSADSRQVYRGMDIGTGKVLKDRNPNTKAQNPKQSLNSKSQILKTPFISGGVAHHLIDVASPKRQFTVVEYQRMAERAIEKILKKKKLPIICGGTGHYIDAVVYGAQFPNVKPNPALRRRLASKPVSELYRMLWKLDPRRARTIDRSNPRRLIRALEIVMTTHRPVPPPPPSLRAPYNNELYTGRGAEQRGNPARSAVPRQSRGIPWIHGILSLRPRPELRMTRGVRLLPQTAVGVAMTRKYDILWLGLNPPQVLLHRNIHRRLLQRLRAGMFAEVKRLRQQGVSSRRLDSFGLEYRHLSRYLEGKIKKTDVVGELNRAIRKYAKRQMTWFKRNPEIRWVKNAKEAEGLVSRFLGSL